LFHISGLSQSLNEQTVFIVVSEPLESVPAARRGVSPLKVRLVLTAFKTEAGQEPQSLEVALAELIAYSQDRTHTRLILRGGKILDVEETTEQIDRLVRAAASQI
jgi:hypothetical protein